jgi:hypothetical protein
METSQTSKNVSKQIAELGFILVLSSPRWNPETKQFDYLATIETALRPPKTMQLEYHTGAGWVRTKYKRMSYDKSVHNMDDIIRPTLADVLHCLILDSSALNEDFENWCSELGYDTDSRKALATYELCRTQGKKVRALLGDKFKAVQTLLQDY